MSEDFWRLFPGRTEHVRPGAYVLSSNHSYLHNDYATGFGTSVGVPCVNVNFSGNYFSVTSSTSVANAWPTEIVARATISEGMAHRRDPDALVGEVRAHLQREIERWIMSTFGQAADDIWRTWTFRDGTHYEHTSDGAWGGWVAETRATRVDTVDTVWMDWATATPIYSLPQQAQAQVPETEEQREAGRCGTWSASTVRPPSMVRPPARAAREERRDALIRANRAYSGRLRSRNAERRAERLLRSVLTERQQADLDRANGFRVYAGDRVYWIARGYSGNVYLLDEQGRQQTSFCIHAMRDLPDYDHMLAQKLLLETDEREFLRIANASRATPYPRLSPAELAV